ncbi:hypothetical protein ACFLQW_02125 [Candidatus Zixiibacteriota bacterium]
MATKKQLTANRKNALKSTGPKSLKGKQLVKWNALKHGLLSQAVIINDGSGQEEKQEFDRLHHQLRQELAPTGTIEEMLVERIATCYWRLRRVLTAEVGEIRKILDWADRGPTLERVKKFNFEMKYIELDSFRDALMDNVCGVEYFISSIDSALEELANSGKLERETCQKLVTRLGHDEGSCMWWVTAFYSMAVNGPLDGDKPDDVPAPEKCWEGVKELLQKEKKRLEFILGFQKKREEWADDAGYKAAHLPDKATVDKILRYETSIERQMYRALNQLERLQRQRKGDLVPAPVSVDVNVNRDQH